MSFAFWQMNNSTANTDISDGESFKGKYLTSLDLSSFDTSKVKKMDCFIKSNKLQVKGDNVNGVNTRGKDSSGNPLSNEELNATNDFRYVTNMNCTSRVGSVPGFVDEDHRNFTDYRLFTLVVTYENTDANKKDQKLDARAYIRYYDANQKLRVFYNDYRENMYFGGCLCSFNQVSSMAIGTEEPAATEPAD